MPKPYELIQVVDHGSDEETDQREVVAIALARVLLNEAITLPATVGVVGVVLALFILSWYDNAQPRRPGKTKIQE
jgi:hypothetical protein